MAGVWVGFDQPHTILPNGFAADLAVPLWAQFMKAATRGDKPEWLDAARAASSRRRVCRLSGKLATDGCEDVEVVDDDGQLERRSMVYTEYFARGTEPTDYCDLHPTRGLDDEAGGPVRRRSGQAARATAIDRASLPADAADRRRRLEPRQRWRTPPAPPKKKRGFWSQLFGIGGNDDREPRRADAKKTDGERVIRSVPAMPFPRHRRSSADSSPARALRRARHAAAEPDLRRARRASASA